MTHDVLAQIFEPFYTTADSDGQRRGSGLGLVFCRQIVESHGGGIQVESEPGHGTTFTLLLPADASVE
jgi:signal transduction histidine kinase